MTLNLYDAKTQLSSLVEMAAAGEEIIIAKNGKPMAKLVAFKDAIKRKPGRLKGKVWMSKDFDAPMTKEELAAFEWSREGRRTVLKLLLDTHVDPVVGP